MPPAGFEPIISAGKRLQNYALERAATGIYIAHIYAQKYIEQQNETEHTEQNIHNNQNI